MTIKNTKQLLGISLALVMLIGSVPLGFSEPLRVQLEQGIETNNIQCDNPNHVLVLRTNGNVACVTEKGAEKMGWGPVSMLSNIVYEYPLYASDLSSKQSTNQIMPSSSSGYPSESLGNLELTLSKIPKVGETADVTIDFTIDVDFEEWESIKELVTPQMEQLFVLRGGLEFVDESDVIDDSTDKWGTKYVLDI